MNTFDASGAQKTASTPSGAAGGDLAGSYPNPTIAVDAVTYAKLQNISATLRILGRKTAAAGDTEECTLSEILDFIGSAARGDILVRGAATWAKLAVGAKATVLRSDATDPSWGAPGDVILLEDRKAQNTQGGSFASGAWRTRVLNTEVQDTGGNCTLASNQFVLAAGTYEILAICPAIDVEEHQAQLQNITGAVTLLSGSSGYAASAGVYAVSPSIIMDRFTVAAAQTLEIQHKCSITSTGTNGFGVASNLSGECYTKVWLRKVG